MQNKKNKKQNGGEAEGKIIFTYVLLTFLLGFIGYCIYWCFGFGYTNCGLFFNYLDQGKWDDAQKIFLERDTTTQKFWHDTKIWGQERWNDITGSNSGSRFQI